MRIVVVIPMLFALFMAWHYYSSCRIGLVKFAKDSEPSALRILFIGNSLTYENDLPAIFVGIIKDRQPNKALKVFASTAPGYALWQHARFNETKQAIINQGPWDMVVLQDQSQMPLNDATATNMDQACLWFDSLIRRNHAHTVLLMTWSDFSKPKNQAMISKVYRKIGQELNATVIPAGELMLEVSRKEPEIPLYLSDGRHPSPYGSYLIACLLCDMLAQIKSEHATGDIHESVCEILPKSIVTIPAPIARKLQKYADSCVP